MLIHIAQNFEVSNASMKKKCVEVFSEINRHNEVWPLSSIEVSVS